MEEKGIRINRFVADTGAASRRRADDLIDGGHVEVQRKGRGRRERADKGFRVMPGDRVFLDGRDITGEAERKVYMILNKPRGIVCTADRSDPKNVIDFVGGKGSLTYAGRLDKDSTGLLLLTNDGELNNLIMKAASCHEKEYICRVDKPFRDDFLKKMAAGVTIAVPDRNHVMRRRRTRPCHVRRIGIDKFAITLTQGYNRQIRRMCAEFGFEVVELKRVRLMTLKLGSLPEGRTRELLPEEIDRLKAMAAVKEAGDNDEH
ncbi:MAG: pseudouridine synthase [Lachnospiraceae bacterium]|nr:pseudouridine synthase [Lachnospiraceae bacterium]